MSSEWKSLVYIAPAYSNAWTFFAALSILHFKKSLLKWYQVLSKQNTPGQLYTGCSLTSTELCITHHATTWYKDQQKQDEFYMKVNSKTKEQSMFQQIPQNMFSTTIFKMFIT